MQSLLVGGEAGPKDRKDAFFGPVWLPYLDSLTAPPSPVRCTVRATGKKRFYNQLADRVSEPKVIVMTTYQSEEDICRALQAGAKGYLIKGAALRQMREAVRTVAAAKSLTIAIEGD